MNQEYGWIMAFDRPRGVGRVMLDTGESLFLHYSQTRGFEGDIEPDVPVRFERGTFTHPMTGRSVAQAIAVERLGPRYHDHDALEPRDEAGDLLEPMQTGTVDRYNPAGGWGHIQASGGCGRIFVHASNVDGERSLMAGDEVRFRRARGTDNIGARRWEATDVEVIAPSAEATIL
jgi:cold shock CspA family protein